MTVKKGSPVAVPWYEGCKIFVFFWESLFSLRSKRFCRAFRRYEAFFAFWTVALAPIFAPPKSKKSLKRAEKPTETRAKQASHCWIKKTETLLFLIPSSPKNFFVFLATKLLKTETGSKLFKYKLLEKETNQRVMRLGKIHELFFNCTLPKLSLSFKRVTVKPGKPWTP